MFRSKSPDEFSSNVPSGSDFLPVVPNRSSSTNSKPVIFSIASTVGLTFGVAMRVVKGFLSASLNLRSTPTLKFFYDDSFEQFEKIDKVIKEID